MNVQRILIRTILAVSLVTAMTPRAPARLAAQAVNTCAIAVPAGTAVTMGDGNQVVPFTVTNTGNDRSIDTVQLEFDASVYDLSLGIVPPENWDIQSKQAGGGQTWVQYTSNGAAYDIGPGESLTFYVPLIGLSNGLFPSALIDQPDALEPGRTFVRDGSTDFSCGTLPAWQRKGLAVVVTAAPLSLAVGQTLVVNMMVTNRSSDPQSGITTTLTYTGSGGVSLTGGPSPGSLTLASGASTSLVYTYTASAEGDVVFTGSAANTNVTSKPGQSDTVYIGAWTASVGINATQVISGQVVTVRMTIQNNTLPSVGNAVPTLTPIGTATATLVTGPTPNKINSIPPGSSGTFEWTYRITGAVGATFAFSGYATDKDGRTTNTSTSPSGAISKYSVVPNPPQSPAGSTNFGIAFTVYNNGGTSLEKVEIAIPPGWTVNDASSYGGYNGNWAFVKYTAGQGTIVFSTKGGGTPLPADKSAVFSVYFTAGPSPASDTAYDFGAALYRLENDNTAQGGATPTVLVTKFRIVLTANPTSGIPADGASASTITATVTQGGTGQAGVTVMFEATAGTLSSATVTTDSQGRAVVRLTAPISTQAITATVTGRYLTAYDTENVAFTGYAGPNPLYVGGTLDPMGGQPGDLVTISLNALNAGTLPITLTTGSVLSFTDGTRVYTSTLASATFIPTDTTRALTFIAATINPAFAPGAYYPRLSLTGWITSSSVTRLYVRPVSDPFSVGMAALRASLSASPGVVSVGQWVTVTMVVTNVGVNTANVITPSALTLGGTGNAALASGPSPASVPTLVSGSVTTLTWTYTATNPGTLNWTGRAQGTDANTGLPVVSAWSTSNNVTAILPAALVASLDAPSTVNQGQTITVTMRVTNTGGAAANSVAPGSLTISGTGSVTYTAGPSPASVVALSGNSWTAFTWTYTAGSLGAVTWSGVVTGTDVNSGQVVTATATSNVVTIQTPAALACALAAAPTSIGTGGLVFVTMTVTNTGQASAQNVNPNPSTLTMSGTGEADFVSGPDGAPATIAGGASAQFTWSFQATAAGAVNWTGNASGADGNSNASVSSANCASNNVTIFAAALLVATLSAQPDSVGLNDTITVLMVVTNQGTVAATSVTPSALAMSGSGAATQTSGPTPGSVTLAGGATVTLTWAYQADAEGDVRWTGNATSSDANPSLPAASNTVNIFTVLIDKTPQGPHPGSMDPGENVTYTIIIRNTGNPPVQIRQMTDTLPAGFAFFTTTGYTSPPDGVSWVGQTITWDYSTSRPSIAGSGGVFTLTFTARTSSSIGAFCNSAGFTRQGGAVTARSNLACITIAWPEYIITAQAGEQAIVVRVRMVSGQPVILSWEIK